MSRDRGGSSLTTVPPIAISPAGDVLEAGDHAQQRRLAAARGPDEHDELARPDREVDAVDHLVVAVGLDDVLERHFGHAGDPAE